MIKKGDKVVLQVPKGRKFVVGWHWENGFAGGITKEMIEEVKEQKEFIVEAVIGDFLIFKGSFFKWDKQWFVKKEEQIIESRIIINGKETMVVIGDKVGKALKNPEDKHESKIGILIATMRALKFSNEEISNVVDVVFDDMPEVKELKDYSELELIDELKRRIRY